MKISRLLVAVAASVCALNAQATIVGGGVTAGSGSWVELTVPFTESTPDNTVGENNFQTVDLYGFNEDQNVSTVSAHTIRNNTTQFGTSTTIVASGTTVASHYIFFDPGPSTTIEGYVDFDAEILGIMIDTNTLAATDYLANTGVTYLNPGLRGLENADQAWIDISDSSRLRIDFTASNPGDYIRVLTKRSPGAVPAPAGFLLFGLGLLGLACTRKQQS